MSSQKEDDESAQSNNTEATDKVLNENKTEENENKTEEKENKIEEKENLVVQNNDDGTEINSEKRAEVNETSIVNGETEKAVTKSESAQEDEVNKDAEKSEEPAQEQNEGLEVRLTFCVFYSLDRPMFILICVWHFGVYFYDFIFCNIFILFMLSRLII